MDEQQSERCAAIRSALHCPALERWLLIEEISKRKQKPPTRPVQATPGERLGYGSSTIGPARLTSFVGPCTSFQFRVMVMSVYRALRCPRQPRLWSYRLCNCTRDAVTLSFGLVTWLL